MSAQHTRRVCFARQDSYKPAFAAFAGIFFPGTRAPAPGAGGAGRRAPGASLASFEPRSSCGTLR